MTPTTADGGLGGGRNHVCLVHDSPDERMRVLEADVADAFARGKRVILLAESTTDQKLSDMFGRTGHGTRPGQLDVRDAADAYLSDGAFDPEAMLAALHTDKRQALADGFTGAHFVADMSWAADSEPVLRQLGAYERAADAVFADGVATATCQYDRTRFDAAAITACAAAHPALVSAFEETETLGDSRAHFGIGRHATVRARGEVDLSNAELFEQALARAAEYTDDEVCVDASQLRFVDVRGLHALMETARRYTLVLLAPSPALRTMLHAVDARRQLPSLRVA